MPILLVDEFPFAREAEESSILSSRSLTESHEVETKKESLRSEDLDPTVLSTRRIFVSRQLLMSIFSDYLKLEN